jgi:hypothetical protein
MYTMQSIRDALTILRHSPMWKQYPKATRRAMVQELAAIMFVGEQAQN